MALPELLDQLAQMFAFQATQKGIEFNCEIEHRLPQVVMTDEKRLRQVLINLLSNAVKYTLAGGVTFRVRYRNQVAEFVIEDTGVGIDAESLKRVFDPFERVRNAATADLPGSGLGLTIVKLLTEIMGGDLQVESTPGEGSCFRVALMLPWVEGAPEVEAQRRVVGYQGAPKTLCVVDDDPVLRGLLADMLQPLGFRICEASSGKECLRLMADVTPDLFLLDIAMPGMDGLQLAAALRQRGCRQPILMLSADVQEQRRQPAGSAVYDEYLVKPVSQQLLLDRIGHYLKLQWTGGDDQPSASGVALEGSEEACTPMPDHPLIRELRGYAEVGYRRGVREVLQRIREAALLSPGQQAKLEQLAAGMQFARLAEYLEQTE